MPRACCLWNALAAVPVHTGEDRGHVLGGDAVEVQLHLGGSEEGRIARAPLLPWLPAHQDSEVLAGTCSPWCSVRWCCFSHSGLDCDVPFAASGRTVRPALGAAAD